MTDYHVFRLAGTVGHMELKATVEAHGPLAAIRSVAGDEGGSWAAVPVRNFTIVTGEVEQPAPRVRWTEVTGQLAVDGDETGIVRDSLVTDPDAEPPLSERERRIREPSEATS